MHCKEALPQKLYAMVITKQHLQFMILTGITKTQGFFPAGTWNKVER